MSPASLLLYTQSRDEHKGAGKAMLKITRIQETRSDVRLKLEGKITAEWAALVNGECRSLLQQGKTVHLDCSNVDFIDAMGIEVMNNLLRAQVTVVSAPGYVTELLEIGDQS
jgi:ABC-type transporter Mla MlaB component